MMLNIALYIYPILILLITLESGYLMFRILISKQAVIYRISGLTRIYYNVIGISDPAFSDSFAAMLTKLGRNFTHNGNDWNIISKNVTIRAVSYKVGIVRISIPKKDALVLKEIISSLRDYYKISSIATTPAIVVCSVVLALLCIYNYYTDKHNFDNATAHYAQLLCDNKLWNKATGLGLEQSEYRRSHPELMEQCVKEMRNEIIRTNNHVASIPMEDPCIAQMWKEAAAQGVEGNAYIENHQDAFKTCESNLRKSHQHP